MTVFISGGNSFFFFFEKQTHTHKEEGKVEFIFD